MSLPPIEALLKRDRVIVLGALLALTALAWSYLRWLDANMQASMASTMPDMPGMTMAPAIRPWTVTELYVAFAMWAVMMVGMMTPSAAPMALIYARVGRQAAAQGKPLAPTLWFVVGYLLAWCGFALFATLAQGALLQLRLITPLLASGSDVFGGFVLLAAGLYQWTPFRDACLAQCRAPAAFIQRHGGFRRSRPASLGLGFRHGLYCIGCCWALMALLFVVGVMNLLWIAALSIWVLLEKIVPQSRLMSRALGFVLIAMAIIMLTGTGL
jgi:predicted metal-binding membrane protein